MRNGFQKVRTFFRKLRQRRPGRNRWAEYQLDVKMPSLKTRPRRRRRHKWAGIRLLAIVCLCITVPAGASWAYRQIFFENQEFKLNRVQIETDGSLAELKIAEASGVKVGMDLMAVDIEKARIQLEALPNVAKAHVTRELPDQIHIRVKERIPVAWLSCPPQGIRPLSVERGFLIDEKGNVFRSLEMQEDLKVLPVIEALKIARPSEGTILESEGIRKAIKMVLKSERSLEALGLQISEVRLKSEWAMECVYRNGMRATFSMFDIDRGINDLREIVTVMGDKEPRIATVNLVAAKNIPVTFVGSVGAGEFKDFLSKDSPPHEEAATPDEQKKQKHLRSILTGG